jgi:hypothetical protein
MITVVLLVAVGGGNPNSPVCAPIHLSIHVSSMCPSIYRPTHVHTGLDEGLSMSHNMRYVCCIYCIKYVVLYVLYVLYNIVLVLDSFHE